MKKLLALLTAVFVMASPVYAQVVTAVMGDQNSSNEYRLKVESNGKFTFASDSGILYPYEEKSTSDTLTLAETGRIFIMTNSSGRPVITLPTAAAGMMFTFIAGGTQDWDIDPQSTDTINWTVAPFSAGDKLRFSGVSGDSATFYGGSSNNWYVRTSQSGDAGSFSDGN